MLLLLPATNISAIDKNMSDKCSFAMNCYIAVTNFVLHNAETNSELNAEYYGKPF